MITATSIDHINMTVKNLDESVAFYKNVFGFEVKRDQPDDHSKIIGNAHIKLCMYEDSEFIRGGGLNHFGFAVEDFGSVVGRCKSLGVSVLYGGEVNWEKSRSVYIEDPSGYIIELSEFDGGRL